MPKLSVTWNKGCKKATIISVAEIPIGTLFTYGLGIVPYLRTNAGFVALNSYTAYAAVDSNSELSNYKELEGELIIRA